MKCHPVRGGVSKLNKCEKITVRNINDDSLLHRPWSVSYKQLDLGISGEVSNGEKGGKIKPGRSRNGEMSTVYLPSVNIHGAGRGRPSWQSQKDCKPGVRLWKNRNDLRKPASIPDSPSSGDVFFVDDPLTWASA